MPETLLETLKDTARCLQRAGGETYHVAVSPDCSLPLVTTQPPSTHQIVWTTPPLRARRTARRRPRR